MCKHKGKDREGFTPNSHQKLTVGQGGGRKQGLRAGHGKKEGKRKKRRGKKKEKEEKGFKLYPHGIFTRMYFLFLI